MQSRHRGRTLSVGTQSLIAPHMLKHHRDIAKSLLFIYMLLCCCSCGTKQHVASTDFRALVRAGNRLGFNIKEHDNHALMLEAASWIGTPYKYGGNSRSGVDCSGLTCAIYQSVFNTTLPRRSLQQWETSTQPRSHSLQQGDLLCFSSKNSQGNVRMSASTLVNKDSSMPAAHAVW